MEYAVLGTLGIIILLVPFTVVPHLLSLLRWRDYPFFPSIRFKSLVWGVAVEVFALWQFVVRYDVAFNDRNWFGTLEERGEIDEGVMLLILLAVVINTVVYYRVTRRLPEVKRAKNEA